jgi:hypothetical protein
MLSMTIVAMAVPSASALGVWTEECGSGYSGVNVHIAGRVSGDVAVCCKETPSGDLACRAERPPHLLE